MRIACWIPRATHMHTHTHTHTHTHRLCYTRCFSRTRLSVKLCVHCLSCYFALALNILTSRCMKLWRLKQHYSNSLSVVLEISSELEHVFAEFTCIPFYIQTSFTKDPLRNVARWELINSPEIYESPLAFEGRYLSPPTKHPWLRNYTALTRSSFQ